jgi:chaperone LolA
VRIISFKILYAFLFLCITNLYLPACSSASEADESVSRIQKAYEGIKDLRGSFIQKNTIKDLKRTDSYKGDFFIKYPSMMKWMYKGKASQDITVNNDAVLIYKKGDKQAYKSRFNAATYGQTPIALLSGFGNIKNEFIVSGNDDTLILKPKNAVGNISSIKIKINEDGFPLKSFVIQDGRSNIIEIELKDIKINTGIKDSIFDLSLPKEVNVFEQPQ